MSVNLSPEIKINWDSVLKCVTVELVGFLDSSIFRAGMEQALKLLEEKKGHRWLADLRAFRIATISDQDWLTNNWLPRAKAAGLLYTATIVPEMAIGQLMAERVRVNAADDGSRYFTTLEAGKRWLETQP